MDAEPHPGSFEDVDTDGDLIDAFWVVDGNGSESGVAQASFDPQASLLEKPEKLLLEVAGTAWAGLGCGGAGADRLKADWRFMEGDGAF